MEEKDQILDFTPIVKPTSTPTPKKVEGVNPNDYFNNIKGKYSPTRIQESDLGKFAGQDLSESSLKRYFKGDEKLESEFALTQSVGDRMINSLKITGANVVATSLGILAEIPDMISTGEIMGENAPIANGLFDWRNEVQKANTSFETFYDKENPFKSILLPGFLTGSSKGWGTILETAGYGIGAGLGIAAQEGIVILMTGGTGSIPALAKGIAKLVKLSDNTRKLAQYIEEGGTALKNIDTALDISEEAYKLEKKAAVIGDGLEGTKDLYRTLAMSYSEAQMGALEGKSNYIDQQKLNFKNTFGYEATGKDLENINKKSSDVYQAIFGANMLLLGASNYVSNKIFFGGLDKLKQGLNQFKSEGIEGTLDKLGNLTFSDNAFKLATTNQWWEKGFGKGLKAGVEKGIDILKKTPLALSEGLEEGGQFIIDKSTNNYFGFDYNKPKNADLLNSIKNATSELFSTTEGQQSMLLGILGGTGQQVVGNIAQFIGDKAYTGNEGYVPLKERKANRIKELNTLADLYNSPEVQAVNVNSVFGTLDKKFKNTSTLLNASGALDIALGNKELERRTSNSIAFQQFSPFVEKGMEDILEGMFKYRVDSLTQEEWEAAGITKSKSEVLQDFNSKLGIVKDAYKIAFKKINPYEKNTQDHLMFEAFKGNYAFTLFQVQADVNEGSKIKQEHSKYFDVLSKFANKNVIQEGRSFLNTKTKEYKDRLELLEQAEPSEFTKTEKKRVKKILEKYQELKDRFKPVDLKKEEYAKLLDELILTTNFEYNLEEDTRDLSEQISDIQDYLSIQDRIKENLEDIKLMQGGSWEETKSFIKKKQKQAEDLGEQQAEIIKETPTPVTPTTNAILQPTAKGTPDDLMGKGRTEPIQTQSTEEGVDRTDELATIREKAFAEAAEEIGIVREDDLLIDTEEDNQKLQQINETVYNDNTLQTKKDFVQAFNKLLDKFIEDKNTSETPVVETPTPKTETSYFTSRARIAFMVGMESETEIGKNYKKALQDIILNQSPTVQIGEERDVVINIKDERLIIEGTKEKPVYYKRKEIGTIVPASTYTVKPEFVDTKDGKKLQGIIDSKDALYNSTEANLDYIAQRFNTKDTYVDVKLEDGRFTKFLYYSPTLKRSIVLDKVIIERYKKDGQTILDIIDDLEGNVKLENGEVIEGVKDSKDRDLVKDELRQIFINSKSIVKEENQFFVFMYGKKEGGQFINVQPINLPNVTKEATEKLESYFDGDFNKISTLLTFDPGRPTDQGWNSDYALIDKSEFTDEERQRGSRKKTPNIKVFLDKKDGIVSLSLLIENQEKRIITKEANGYLLNGTLYDSIEDILKSINPNYEIREQKKAGQEYNHEFAKAHFKLREAAGRIYSTQQIILTPKKSLIKTVEKITTQVEMKPESVKTPEPIIVKQEVEKVDKIAELNLQKQEELKPFLEKNIIEQLDLSEYPFVRTILNKYNIEVKIVNKERSEDKFNTVATYSPASNIIELDFEIGTKSSTLIHEIIHGVLYKGTNTKNRKEFKETILSKKLEKFYAEVDKTYWDYAKNKSENEIPLTEEDIYIEDILANIQEGLSSQEIVTYALTDKIFAKWLNSQKGISKGFLKSNYNSLWQWLKDIILNNTVFQNTKLSELSDLLDDNLEIILDNRKDINIKGEIQVAFDRINKKYDKLIADLETSKLESIIALKDANQNIKVEITPEIIAKVVKMMNESDLDTIYQEYLNGDSKRMKSYILESDMLQSIFQEFPNLKQIKETPSMRNISIEEKLQEYLTTCK